MSYYRKLKISDGANTDEIRSAYKNEVQKLHRLKLEGSILERMQAELDAALEVLIDPERRTDYDLRLAQSDQSGHSLSGKPLFNFANFRTNNKPSWLSLSEHGESDPVKAVSALFDRTLSLPDTEIQRPFLLSAILTPSALAESLPLIFCFGSDGSGKSLICKIVAKLWNTYPLTSGSTPTALRNQIEAIKWGYYEGIKIEKNCGIVLNDLTLKQLAGNQLLTAFLKAYDRNESTIAISSPDKDGKNLEFDVFSNRIISSVIPFFALDDFRELGRRMLTIYCEKAKDAHDLLGFSDIDFKGIENVIPKLWENPDNCARYAAVNVRKAAKGKKINIDRLDTYRSIIATGVTLGIFPSVSEAIDAFADLEKYQTVLRNTYGDTTKQLLSAFMRAKLKQCIKMQVDPVVPPLVIQSFLQSCAREGKIERKPSTEKIKDYLTALGYKYDNKYHHWSE
jgi:DnaJ domain